jgi:hypothetical protein
MDDNKKIIIKVFSSFCSSEDGKRSLENSNVVSKLPFYGKDKRIYITTENNYTHVVILNTAMPNIPHIPRENVIGLAYEPIPFLQLTQQFVDYAVKHIGIYLIGDVQINPSYCLPAPFIGHYSFMGHCVPLPYIPKKKNRMSIMISNKQYAPGHIYRHTLTQAIIQSNLPIDIYGRGCEYYSKNDYRIKGQFTEYEPYESYDFHICIENYRSQHYLSEKIVNPLICGTTPIYLGCLNIEMYFPGNVIHLTGNVEEDMILLRNILEKPESYKKEIPVDEILNNINLINYLDKQFRQTIPK